MKLRASIAKEKTLIVVLILGSLLTSNGVIAEPIQIGFLWHMHQPNYYPY